MCCAAAGVNQRGPFEVIHSRSGCASRRASFDGGKGASHRLFALLDIRMSRTVLALIAAGGMVSVLAVEVIRRGGVMERPTIDQAAKQVVVAQPIEAKANATKPTPGNALAAHAAMPTFDVARIGADGRVVVAGRAAPGAKVFLLDGG